VQEYERRIKTLGSDTLEEIATPTSEQTETDRGERALHLTDRSVHRELAERMSNPNAELTARLLPGARDRSQLLN
jgi:hypothetical protein